MVAHVRKQATFMRTVLLLFVCIAAKKKKHHTAPDRKSRQKNKHKIVLFDRSCSLTFTGTPKSETCLKLKKDQSVEHYSFIKNDFYLKDATIRKWLFNVLFF